MFSSIVIVIIVFIFLLFFMFYKRDMLIKMFSIDVTSSANRFQQQLEETADIVIKRLEGQISHLEYLLEEANEKINILDKKIQSANYIIEKKELSPLLSETNLVMPDMNIKKAEIINLGENPDEADSLHSHEKPVYILNMDQDKRIAIIEMAELGYDVTEIAKTTGMSKGEIILLLQLNKK